MKGFQDEFYCEKYKHTDNMYPFPTPYKIVKNDFKICLIKSKTSVNNFFFYSLYRDLKNSTKEHPSKDSSIFE